MSLEMLRNVLCTELRRNTQSLDDRILLSKQKQILSKTGDMTAIKIFNKFT